MRANPVTSSGPEETPRQPVPTVRVQAADFDTAAEIARLQRFDRVGAVVSFTGVCRDEDGRLAALELEHYPGMAEAEIERIAQEATTRWPLAGVTVVHRFGRIAVGENIVLVVTASSHRQAAFEAASFLMDFLKTRAPFWKKEHPADPDAGAWVAAKAEDDDATGRW
jgi:molybdopterin synthase catalytic subunit